MRSVENTEKYIFGVLSNFCVVIRDLHLNHANASFRCLKS